MGLGYTDPDAMDLFTAMMSGLTNQQLSNEPGGRRWARLIERSVDMFIEEMATNRAVKTTSAAKSRKHRSTTTGSTRTTKRGR
jgi:hypothetical protein